MASGLPLQEVGRILLNETVAFMNNTSRHRSFSDFLVGFISFLLAIPLFIILHKHLPDPDWPFNLDRILLFVLLVMILVLFLRLFRIIIIIGFAAALAWLAYGQLAGKYGFADLYKDYRAMIYSMQNDPNPESFILADRQSISQRNEILSAVNENDPAVRNFAVASTNEFFRSEQQKNEAYRNLIQCFAIFKKINSNWNYVNDPSSREYFAKPSESIRLLAGDCDDHSIVMGACIKAIGGTPRFVITTTHMYPELLVGDKKDLERVNYLIKKELFPNESRGQDVHYHQDNDGKVWINLDYSGHYPGGQFINEPVEQVFYP